MEGIHIQKEINGITCGIMSPKLIKNMSNAKVVTPELYDREGYPVDGGLMDVRLGVIDPGLRCKTCGGRLKECPGHFGHLELARPVVHINFVDIILDLLRCTCSDCGKILIPMGVIDSHLDELERVTREEGLSARQKKIKQIIASLRTVAKCPYCDATQKKIRIEKPTTFYENDKRLLPIEIRMRLEKIPNEDLVVFGLNPKVVRPEWFILTLFSVPPVTMRPSITLESGERSEDDLTHKIGDIVRINQRLFENINAGAPEIIIEDLWDLLQYHVTTFFDNAVVQLPPARHRGGQPLKTLSARIKSKEGRIRHNLVGKRTNFSARTVISPDPRLEINEVGVPMEVAMKLSVPEVVTDWNKEYLLKLLKNGPKKYPGANYVARPDGRKKKISDDNKEQILEEIEPGFVVERHLIDGDIVLFNRQPSLHRMSMMCHKVRVLPGKTFRINPSVCAPYNADFDGDEMNLHVPQTYEARAEAKFLMEVQTQMNSPRFGLSVIGCNQDAISGNYILTKYLEFDYDDAVEILYSVGVTDFSRLPKRKKVSGKEMFSLLIPPGFNFEAQSKDKSPVVFKDGMLVEGVMDKANLGDGSGLLLRTLQKMYGADLAVGILGRMYRLGAEIVTRNGFSVKLSDTDLSESGFSEVKSIIEKAEADVDKAIREYQEGKLEPMPGRTTLETLELNILMILNKARDDSGVVVSKTVDPDSHTMVMANSGSRGNIINLAQMAACVGQQALRGGRITNGYGSRTLSMFKDNDLGSASRGFIKHSLKAGMKSYEMFFMAMTGRDSLMDTALRTPKSGYLYRRISNALQDLKVVYDHSVRDASGRIVQFKYGEDGLDITKTEGGIINVKRIIESLMVN